MSSLRKLRRYIQKVERKGRTKAEVDTVIQWLTGYDEQGLQSKINSEADFETFFAEAPQINPNASQITDELAKGKPMEKVLRSM